MGWHGTPAGGGEGGCSTTLACGAEPKTVDGPIDHFSERRFYYEMRVSIINVTLFNASIHHFTEHYGSSEF